MIYLTFDDGPMPGPTDFALDELARFGARATFFCIGDNIQKHPDTFARIRKEGHLPANHTFNHLSGWGIRSVHYRDNIKACETLLDSRQGEPKLFRPPYGRLHPFKGAIPDGYQIVMWDVLSCDYDPGLDQEKSLEALKRFTRPGAIVVFHDSLKAEKNLRFLLPRYLQFLSDSGYRLETIPAN